MGEVVFVVLKDDEGRILSVSRKDDHTKFGLPGGKVESSDLSLKMAAIREVEEETGLMIYNLKLVFAMHSHGYMGYTYIANYDGEINYDKEKEPHIVKWKYIDELFVTKHGKWHENVYNSLKSMGIELKLKINI